MYRWLLAVEMPRSAGPGPQNQREELRLLLREALDLSGGPWPGSAVRDHAGGVLLVLPEGVSPSWPITVMDRLAERLRGRERAAPAGRWIRAALHAGENDVSGTAVEYVFELLRSAVRPATAPLVAVISDAVRDIVLGQPGLDVSALREAAVRVRKPDSAGAARDPDDSVVWTEAQVRVLIYVPPTRPEERSAEPPTGPGWAEGVGAPPSPYGSSPYGSPQPPAPPGGAPGPASPRPQQPSGSPAPAGAPSAPPMPQYQPQYEQPAAPSTPTPQPSPPSRKRSRWRRRSAPAEGAWPHSADDDAPPPQPTRYLAGHLPVQAAPGSEVSLIVRICADQHADGGFKMAALRRLRGDEVAVIVQAPRALVPLDGLERVVRVPSKGDSEPVRFPFRADGTGLQKVQVTAWAGGTFLAELALEISLKPYASQTGDLERRAPIPSTAPTPGEVTLQVRFDGRHHTFQLLTDACLYDPVVAESLAAEPTAAVERTIATLRQMAAGGGEYSGPNARTWLEQAGIGLWRDMVPARIQDQFWELRDQVSAFSIADDRGVIPWELLYPLAPGRDDGGFLVERYPVLRRVFGQQRYGDIGLGPPRFVAPPGSPANAQEEITAIRGVFGARPTDTIGDLSELLALIESGAAGPLHFACHNTFDPDGSGSSIGMNGGPLVPDLLNRAAGVRSLAAGRPLVFLNACRTAGVVMRYTRMTGWAQQFMTAGAGAFVGTLWAVRSESATRFARPFYAALKAGVPLGEASRIARTEARADDGDPSWLAYTVYGSPTARAVPGLTA